MPKPKKVLEFIVFVALLGLLCIVGGMRIFG